MEQIQFSASTASQNQLQQQNISRILLIPCFVTYHLHGGTETTGQSHHHKCNDKLQTQHLVIFKDVVEVKESESEMASRVQQRLYIFGELGR